MINQTLATISRNIIALTIAGKSNDLKTYRALLAKPGLLSQFELAAINQYVDKWQSDQDHKTLSWD